jgi:hypothetical protein
MRGPRQLRKAINRMRRKWGKKNGVLPICCFDYGGRPNPETDKREKKPRYRKIETDQYWA